MNKKIFLVDLIRLQQKKFFIKWIDELKDEVIIFIDIKNTIRVFSSICPHFGHLVVPQHHLFPKIIFILIFLIWEMIFDQIFPS